MRGENALRYRVLPLIASWRIATAVTIRSCQTFAPDKGSSANNASTAARQGVWPVERMDDEPHGCVPYSKTRLRDGNKMSVSVTAVIITTKGKVPAKISPKVTLRSAMVAFTT